MKSKAFTLIEVVIALGIAAAALILLLSANRAALDRASRARRNAFIDALAESKLDEIRCGAETNSQGTFAEIPEIGWSWVKAPAEVDGLTHMDRLTFFINYSADNVPIKTLNVFTYNPQTAQSTLPVKKDGKP
jgi:type II secretory pathway pseudopilin PulG